MVDNMGGGHEYMNMTAPPSSSPSMPGMDGHKGGGMMHMTFFWGKSVQILFTGWPGDRGVGVYVGALLFVLVLAAFVEILSAVSRRLGRPSTGHGWVSVGLLPTVIHAVRTALSYLAMLAVMSFNVGVLIAAVLGHAIGFLVASCWLSDKARSSGGHENQAGDDGRFDPAKC